MLNRRPISINYSVGMLKTLLTSVIIVATPAHSDILSLADGQVFDRRQFQELTLDLAGRAEADSQRLGVRVTLPRFLNHYALFVEANSSHGDWNDLAVNGATEFSGSGTGGGFYFTGLPEWKNVNTTFKLSYHSEDNNIDTPIVVSGQATSVDHEQQTVTASVLLSPNAPIRDNGLNAYVALGLVNVRSNRRVNVDRQEELRLRRTDNSVNGYLAAGLVYPVNRLRFYAVAEIQEQLSLSLGLRWNITKTKQKETL